MKLFTCLTPSHGPMFDQHFAPSVPLSGLVLQPPRILEQKCPTGVYESAGFQETCMDKMRYLLNILEVETEPFVFSDVDVRFYGRVVEDLMELAGDSDDEKAPNPLFQSDGPGGACTGFMLWSPCPWAVSLVEDVIQTMGEKHIEDQIGMHHVLRALGLTPALLPSRYWTVGQTGRHWNPGQPVRPPHDLLMHHANWTVGVENKMDLLQLVKDWRTRLALGCQIPAQSIAWENNDKETIVVERSACVGPLTIEESVKRSAFIETQDPMPLALVLQTWQGDADRAAVLLRLLADIERIEVQDDVLVVAVQEGTQRKDLEDAIIYAARRFAVSMIYTKVDLTKTYPGIAFDPWASAVDQLSQQRNTGKLRPESAFFFEPDGCPLRTDWRAWLKRAHTETLQHGKNVTGARMREQDHINGSLVMHLDLWADKPSLHVCPPESPWDIHHGHTLVSESHTSHVIRNEFGLHVSREMFLQYRRESAWLTGVKDGSHHEQARTLLVSP
jgi:hypothetical protein